MNKISFLLIITRLLFSLSLIAQVPVREEPLHKPVLENQYVRLLDVWMQPGDTSLYHIHATPSVFLFFTKTKIGSQIMGGQWVIEESIAGKTWYRSFTPDSLIHRVSNPDTIPLHVTDVEILSSFEDKPNKAPLPFPLLYQSEKAFAYGFTENSGATKTISNRGPMIAELVEGTAVYYVDAKTHQQKEIKAGSYLYIEPDASFYFMFNGKEKLNMVLFEIK